MKTRLSNLIPLILILILGISGCAAPASPPAPSQPPPTPIPPTKLSPTENPRSAVVLDMVKHLNDGDAEGSLAYFADNAMIYFIGMPPTGV